jgi:hypothetical protein
VLVFVNVNCARVDDILLGGFDAALDSEPLRVLATGIAAPSDRILCTELPVDAGADERLRNYHAVLILDVPDSELSGKRIKLEAYVGEAGSDPNIVGYNEAWCLDVETATEYLDRTRVLDTGFSKEHLGYPLPYLVASPEPIDGLDDVQETIRVRLEAKNKFKDLEPPE